MCVCVCVCVHVRERTIERENAKKNSYEREVNILKRSLSQVHLTAL